MSSILAHRVFSDLVSIAQSRASLGDRGARAARRVYQFIADIKKTRFHRAVKGRFIERLRAELETAVVHSPALGEESRTVLHEALNTLMVAGAAELGFKNKSPARERG
jgi:hypothetical protein